MTATRRRMRGCIFSPIGIWRRNRHGTLRLISASTHPSQHYGFCLRRFFMVNLPHGRETQGSLGVLSLLLRPILRIVRLNGLSVIRLSVDESLRGLHQVAGCLRHQYKFC
jgi:hypothetical protein